MKNLGNMFFYTSKKVLIYGGPECSTENKILFSRLPTPSLRRQYYLDEVGRQYLILVKDKINLLT